MSSRSRSSTLSIESFSILENFRGDKDTDKDRSISARKRKDSSNDVSKKEVNKLKQSRKSSNVTEITKGQSAGSLGASTSNRSQRKNEKLLRNILAQMETDFEWFAQGWGNETKERKEEEIKTLLQMFQKKKSRAMPDANLPQMRSNPNILSNNSGESTGTSVDSLLSPRLISPYLHISVKERWARNDGNLTVSIPLNQLILVMDIMEDLQRRVPNFISFAYKSVNIQVNFLNTSTSNVSVVEPTPEPNLALSIEDLINLDFEEFEAFINESNSIGNTRPLINNNDINHNNSNVIVEQKSEVEQQSLTSTQIINTSNSLNSGSALSNCNSRRSFMSLPPPGTSIKSNLENDDKRPKFKNEGVAKRKIISRSTPEADRKTPDLNEITRQITLLISRNIEILAQPAESLPLVAPLKAKIIKDISEASFVGIPKAHILAAAETSHNPKLVKKLVLIRLNNLLSRLLSLIVQLTNSFFSLQELFPMINNNKHTVNFQLESRQSPSIDDNSNSINNIPSVTSTSDVNDQSNLESTSLPPPGSNDNVKQDELIRVEHRRILENLCCCCLVINIIKKIVNHLATCQALVSIVEKYKSVSNTVSNFTKTQQLIANVLRIKDTPKGENIYQFNQNRPKLENWEDGAGSLNSLVLKLTSTQSIDSTFMKSMITTYMSFTSSEELFSKLMERYHVPSSTAHDEKLQIQLRICVVMKYWIETKIHTFDDSLINCIQQFIDVDLRKDYHYEAANLLSSTLKRSLEKLNEEVVVVLPKIEIFEYKWTPTEMVLNASEKDIAEQITLISWRLFKSIDVNELLNLAWTKKQTRHQSPNIQTSIKRFNEFSFWVATMILVTEKLKDRSLMITKFISVARELRKLNNFDGLMYIISGLQNSAVDRLKFSKFSVHDDLLTSFEEMSNLMNPHSSWKSYRDVLRSSIPPAIPFLGVYLTDLTFIEEGNPSSYRDGELINFNKRQMVYKVLQEIILFQSIGYSIEPKEPIYSYLTQLPYLPEKDLYDLSSLREPRGASFKDLL